MADGRFPRARAAGHAKSESHAARHAAGRLPRLRPDALNTRPARFVAEDHEPDARDRRPSRHLDTARRQRIHPQQHSRRIADDPGCGAYFQHRTAARFYRRGGRLFDAEVAEANRPSITLLRFRHCERSEAIQSLTNEEWIASSRSLLAMTGEILQWMIRNAATTAWRSVARCWAMPGSTNRSRAKIRSTPTSSISSLATPGVRSGPGR